MTLRQISSAITTLPKEADLQTLTEHTETGAIALSNTQNSKALARLIEAKETPADITNKVIKCVESLVTLQIKYDKDFNIQKFTINSDSKDNLIKAYKAMLQSCVPLPTSDIEQRLTAMLPLITLPANMDMDMAILKIETIAKKLSEFPADMVIKAIEKVEQTCKFMPTYAEFYAHIYFYHYERKKLLDSLQISIDKFN